MRAIGVCCVLTLVNVAQGWTALQCAVLHGHVACMEALLRARADAAQGTQKVPGCTLRAHADVWLMECLMDGQHGAPMLLAARQGRAECIEALARHGVDVNDADTVRSARDGVLGNNGDGAARMRRMGRQQHSLQPVKGTWSALAHWLGTAPT